MKSNPCRGILGRSMLRCGAPSMSAGRGCAALTLWPPIRPGGQRRRARASLGARSRRISTPYRPGLRLRRPFLSPGGLPQGGYRLTAPLSTPAVRGAAAPAGTLRADDPQRGRVPWRRARAVRFGYATRSPRYAVAAAARLDEYAYARGSRRGELSLGRAPPFRRLESLSRTHPMRDGSATAARSLAAGRPAEALAAYWIRRGSPTSWARPLDRARARTCRLRATPSLRWTARHLRPCPSSSAVTKSAPYQAARPNRLVTLVGPGGAATGWPRSPRPARRASRRACLSSWRGHDAARAPAVLDTVAAAGGRPARGRQTRDTIGRLSPCPPRRHTLCRQLRHSSTRAPGRRGAAGPFPRCGCSPLPARLGILVEALKPRTALACHGRRLLGGGLVYPSYSCCATAGLRAARLRGDRRERRVHCGDLPSAGRPAAGDRAGRRPVAHALPGSGGHRPGRPVPAADRRQPHRAAPATHTARGRGLELEPAHRAGAAARRTMPSSVDDTATAPTGSSDRATSTRRGQMFPGGRRGRFRRLATISEYGLERLAAVGGWTGPWAAHAAYFLRWSRQPTAPAPRGAAWLRSLRPTGKHKRR